jgi:hypothetical protein
MTKDKALRLALEALEKISMGSDPRWADQAITAIEAVLEAKDEPVAYLPPTASPDNACYIPPQRTWVGLTNQELADCWNTIPERAMRRVEAKLKEKNNG